MTISSNPFIFLGRTPQLLLNSLLIEHQLSLYFLQKFLLSLQEIVIGQGREIISELIFFDREDLLEIIFQGLIDQIQILSIVLELFFKISESLQMFISSSQLDVLYHFFGFVLTYYWYEVIQSCYLLCQRILLILLFDSIILGGGESMIEGEVLGFILGLDGFGQLVMKIISSFDSFHHNSIMLAMAFSDPESGFCCQFERSFSFHQLYICPAIEI